MSSMSDKPGPEPRADGPAQPRMDAFLCWLARLALRSFYARIEVIGADRLPSSGPVIVMANHSNSLVDAMVITGFLPRMPRFLAASTVWDYKPLIGLLKAAGAIPVYRVQDGRQRHGVLGDTFSIAAGFLVNGGVLAVFPEGVSHNEPRVLPLKPGVARIALRAEAAHGPLGIRIVPLCLIFEKKQMFRSRVLVEFGQPVEIAPEIIKAYRSGSKACQSAAAKALTQDLAQELEVLTPVDDNWEDNQLIGRAAEILSHTEGVSHPDRPMAELAKNQKTVRHGYAWTRQMHPERTAALRGNLCVYDSMLRTAGLGDLEVARHAKVAINTVPIARTALSIATNLPMAGLGLALNWLPFQLMLQVSKGKDRDKRSTWSIFGGMLVFPVSWILTALLFGVWGAAALGPLAGWLGALATLVAAPVAGQRSLKLIDTLSQIAPSVRAMTRLRSANILGHQLVEQRRVVVEDLTALSEAYSAEQDRLAAATGLSRHG